MNCNCEACCLRNDSSRFQQKFEDFIELENSIARVNFAHKKLIDELQRHYRQHPYQRPVNYFQHIQQPNFQHIQQPNFQHIHQQTQQRSNCYQQSNFQHIHQQHQQRSNRFQPAPNFQHPNITLKPKQEVIISVVHPEESQDIYNLGTFDDLEILDDEMNMSIF